MSFKRFLIWSSVERNHLCNFEFMKFKPVVQEELLFKAKFTDGRTTDKDQSQ